MVRGLADAVLLFILPFVVSALLLGLNRRFGLFGPRWAGGRAVSLTAAGLGLVLAALVVYGLLSPRGRGAYVPAHVEDGRLVPGRIQ